MVYMTRTPWAWSTLCFSDLLFLRTYSSAQTGYRGHTLPNLNVERRVLTLCEEINSPATGISDGWCVH